jgi:hypothetical protein
MVTAEHMYYQQMQRIKFKQVNFLHTSKNLPIIKMLPAITKPKNLYNTDTNSSCRTVFMPNSLIGRCKNVGRFPVFSADVVNVHTKKS